VASGWGGSIYAGPLRTIDISSFTAPFSIQ